MRNAEIYRYEFDPASFTPWEDADGQWISNVDVVPSFGDTRWVTLLEAHVDAGIELRIVPSLWPLHDLARSGEFDFSLVRMRNAQPRHSP